MKNISRIFLSLLIVMMLALQTACFDSTNSNKETSEKNKDQQPDPLAVNIKLMIGNDKKWIVDEVQDILNQNNITVSGKKIKILYDKAGTGESMEKVLDPNSSYDGWIPASSTYVSLTNEKWLKMGEKSPRVNDKFTTIFLTPTVIAMPENMAKKMGYPEKSIGWADVLSLSTNKDGWGVFGDSSLNPVRFAHTHPAKSNTGLNTLIAEEYAFSNKTKGITIDDIKKNSDKIKAVEQTVTYYGESTSLLKDKMIQKGDQFIQFAVLYEYMVGEMNNDTKNKTRMTAVYPKEGSLWADIVFTEVYNKNASQESKQAIDEIKKALVSEKIQKDGMEKHYLRPADTKIALSDAISLKNGINPQEPKTVLEMPGTEVCNAILDDWIKNMKKRANVSFVIDTSGSMEGDPLDNLKLAMYNILNQDNSAKDYLNIDAQDYVSLTNFGDSVTCSNAITGDKVGNIKSKIQSLEATGSTALYDAIYTAIEKNVETAKSINGKRINILVVLTDGQDNMSKHSFDDLMKYIKSHKGEVPVIMTIGYGDVNKEILESISLESGGQYNDGSPEKIQTLMKTIKTFF